MQVSMARSLSSRLMAWVLLLAIMDSTISFRSTLPFRLFLRSSRSNSLCAVVAPQQNTLKASPKSPPPPSSTSSKPPSPPSSSSSSLSSSSGNRQAASTGTNKVFLGNLPFTITEQAIQALIDDVLGKNLVTHINVIRGAKSKRPMGILFIDFVNPESAERAVAFLDGYDLDGRILNSNLKYPEEIEEAKRQKAAEKERQKQAPLRIAHTVYLSNLDYSLGEEEISNMCDDLVGVGLVSEVRIPRDKNTGSPRGFAYIEFHDPSSVETAINELTNVEVYGRLLRADKMSPPAKRAKQEDELY